MKQKIKRLTALVCAVAMMAALCLALRPVDTAYGASLNDQLAETRAKKQEIQQQLDQIKSDKAKALEQKELLDQQAAVIAQQIDLLELQIKDTQDRITENEAQEEQQYQLFCRQVRQEEERGAVSYWSVLFKATGFADLLSRMDFINEIVEHDQSVIDQLRTLREQLAQDKADLEQQQAELTASKTELDAQVAEATRVFEEYAASEAGQQALLNQQAAREKELQEEIRKLSESGIPIFAICLGHQLMALAHGFKTYKMKYGHRGANHPVMDLHTRRVYISSQNHGYVVDGGSLDDTKAKPWFINVNDKTIEGLEYIGKPVKTVQFHPEANAGPKDSEVLFEEFIKMMGGNQ